MLKIYSDDELISKSNNYDEVICFGIGKRFEKVKLFFEYTSIFGKISYIVDNDRAKQGMNIIIGEKTLKVMTLSELALQNLKPKSLILITPIFYTEIIQQINVYESLRNFDIICMTHVLGISREEEILNVNMPLNIKLTNIPMIPKTIHYCWFGGKTIPDKYKYCIDSWHKYCPDYEIIEWNESNYDITKNKYMQQAYEYGKWAFVPDYARLDIIYTYGGIYLDTDVELLHNIDDMLYQKGFAGFETDDYVALGLGFGAVKNMSIVKKMKDMYDDLEFIDKKGNMDLTASPKWQTQLLKDYGLQTNGKYQIIEDMTIYPIKVLNGKTIHRKKSGIYPKSIHHYELSSWQEKKYVDLLSTLDRDMEMYYGST